jgi:hypothetical protein
MGLLTLEGEGFRYERHLPAGVHEHELSALACFAALA